MRRTPNSRSTAGGERVDTDDHRPGHRHDRPDRGAEHQGGAVGAGQGDVLRDHLAEHDVEVDHDGQARPRTRPGGGATSGTCSASSDGLEQVRDRGLADGTEHQRAHRDAELVDRRSPATCSPSRAGWCGRSASPARRGARSGYDVRRPGRTPRRRRTRCRAGAGARRADRGRRSLHSAASWRPVGLEQPEGEPVDAQPVHVLDGERRPGCSRGSVVGVGRGRAPGPRPRRRARAPGRATWSTRPATVS